MKWVFSLGVIFSTAFVYGQSKPTEIGKTTIAETEIDLGEIFASTIRYADVKINNPTTKKCYILRVEQSPEVVHKASIDVVPPGESFTLRLQVNPKKEGKFSFIVKVYLSDQPDPILLRLTGNVKEVPPYSNTFLSKCPDFNSTPPKHTQSSELTIITVDKITGKRLSESTVAIIRNGKPAGAWTTGRNGEFKEKISSGYFYFFASHDGYFPKEAGVYIGPEISEITIPLAKDPAFCPPVPVKESPVEREEPEQLSAEKAADHVKQQLNNVQTDSVIRKELPELATLPLSNFDAEYFKPVNVVFVLDISSSMKQGDRMDLMKYALNELTSNLRSEDIISLVTYAEFADVLLEPTNGNQQETIQQKVDDLKPEGVTAGGRGIKLGYKLVTKNLSSERTNMVIIITDGAFNKDSDDYKKTVQKNAEKGIIFSVVGVQNRPKEEAKMREAAQVGNGRYIPIAKLADAQHNLLQEIRIASFKRK